MIKNRKIIVITFIGRKTRLELLKQHVLREKNVIDKWLICWHVVNKEDETYCRQLHAQLQPFTEIIYHKNDNTFCDFYQHFIDANAIYVKLDDDIVWMEENAIQKLASFTIEH